MTKEIELTQDKVALVDDEDFEWLSQWKWHAYWDGHNWYAKRAERMISNGRRQRTVNMHRTIMNVSQSDKVDHVDGNGLNNQRHNLRVATHQQNVCNRSLYCNNSSGYKGVGWHKQHQKWHAKIQNNGKRIHLGYFDTALEAARAYDEAAKDIHGEFARINF